MAPSPPPDGRGWPGVVRVAVELSGEDVLPIADRTAALPRAEGRRAPATALVPSRAVSVPPGCERLAVPRQGSRLGRDAGVRRRAIGSRVAAASGEEEQRGRRRRFFGQLDWGGLPRALVEESITRASPRRSRPRPARRAPQGRRASQLTALRLRDPGRGRERLAEADGPCRIRTRVWWIKSTPVRSRGVSCRLGEIASARRFRRSATRSISGCLCPSRSHPVATPAGR